MAYVQYMERTAAYYERLSLTLLGREPRQVLLLDGNVLNADHLRSLAAMLQRRGYHFMSLDRALTDPAHESEGKRGVFFKGEPAIPEDITKAATLRPSRPRR